MINRKHLHIKFDTVLRNAYNAKWLIENTAYSTAYITKSNSTAYITKSNRKPWHARVSSNHTEVNFHI